MKTENILYTWMGHADLSALADTLNSNDKQALSETLGFDIPPARGRGPIRTLLEQVDFDEVHILSNYPEPVNSMLKTLLGSLATIHHVSLENPSNYEEIYKIAVNELTSTIDHLTRKTNSHPALSILLSPGTPAMAGIWLLLGKTKFPATFYQTHEGKAEKARIPFDLVVDFLPEVLRNSNAAFKALSQAPRDIKGFEHIVGESSALRDAVNRTQKTALRDVSALFIGESGTGKELFSKAIHNASSRKNGPFITVNCAAIPKDLLESELFGHVKGAFTGAISNKKGAFAAANQGILFLDELGECPLDIQTKLLRVLQPPVGTDDPCVREFKPVGSERYETANVRLVTATNRNLLEMIGNNEFREDLYYRIAAVVIKLPPLRNRKTDIPALALHLLEKINTEFAKHDPTYISKKICQKTKKIILEHRWPGNVRELNNVLLQAAVLSEDIELSPQDIQEAILELPLYKQKDESEDLEIAEGFNLEEHLNKIKISYIKKANQMSGGVKVRASELLGYRHYQTFSNQLENLKIEWKRR